MRSISIIVLVIYLASCSKSNEKKQSRLVIISVTNNCYATIKFYKENGNYYTKETFNCEYEKEVYRQFDTGIYKINAEGENKKIEMYFTKTDFETSLNIEF